LKLRITRCIAAVTVAVGLFTITAPSAAFADDWRAAAQAEIDNYRAEHPEDLTGIDALLVKYGLPPMKVSINDVPGTLSGAEAEKILADRQKTAGGVTTQAVPTDAFGVWISLTHDLYNNRVVVGNWDFRDNYVNGSAPDDVAAIQGNIGECWRIKSGGLSYRVSDYTGAVQANRIYTYDAGLNGSPIIGVRDRVQGFRLLVDNGYFQALYESTKKSGCTSSSSFGAQFQYEHNQDGENGFSAGASWGSFGVSYSAQCTTLRKSSNVVYV
jgi:hypothetical protein